MSTLLPATALAGTVSFASTLLALTGAFARTRCGVPST
jgi:hypothetical protein